MDLVNLVITPVVQSLLVPVKKHLGFLVSSTKYFKDMKEKMVQLNLTEQDVQEKKKKADANNHEVSHHVSPWLEDVKKMKEKAESIPTGGTGCFNVARRYRTGKQSYNILEQIKALKEQESEINWTNERRSLAKVPSTSTPVPQGTRSTFESRDLVFNDALQSLQSNNESQKMIALCGMGGLDKTTMMEQLKKAVEDSKMFDWVVKVVIGENTDPIALQRAVAEYISEDLSETTKDARADRLRKIFDGMSQKGQKVLVIMDDLWNVVDLKDVGLSPLPEGFKLLFTSRNENVCTHMGVRINSIHKVGFLNDAEAKTLFFGIVGLSDGDDPALQKIGEDIVKKCGGLPIAITTIAKSLSGNIEEAWKKALWHLQKDDLQDLESITQRIFEMSYENLKEDDDKAIFLLSGLFPDDFDIPTEDLLRYGWGLGFFKGDNTLATARNNMKICVNNLIRANLLTKSDRMGCVNMHDLVRAFVLNKISDVKQASIVNHDNKSEQRLTKDANESYDRILLKCTHMTKFPEDFDYPNLSMLMLMDGYELQKFPENIYERMKKLEVVYYEKIDIPLLPVTFEHSTKLRTLCLRSCSVIIDEIPIVGSLSNLEILSFVDCGLRTLPSTIGKLKKLKLLDLTGCIHLRVDDGVFQNLGNLQELYMRAYDDSPIRFTYSNCDELETLSRGLFALEFEFFKSMAQPKNVSFKNLERFRISIGCKLVNSEDGEECSFRNTIQFVGECNELLDCKINDLFEKTEELHLQVNDMSHLEDVSMHHTFSYLTVLHVSKCADLTYLFTYDVASGLKTLERLTVSECPVMTTLVDEYSRVGVIRFRRLNFMSLNDLPKMVSLWHNMCKNVIELPEMLELRLNGLPNFTSVYSSNNNMSPMQSLLRNEVDIPKLETLDISMMENLKQIWPCEISSNKKNNVSMLRRVRVTRCDSLMNLFPCNPLPLLNHLEEVEIEKCGSIEVLFNINFKSVCEMEGYIGRLRSVELKYLGKLTELWRMRGVNNSDIHINGFKGVQRIYIERCSMFKNIFTPTTTSFDLGALREYITRNTSEDVSLAIKGEISGTDDYAPNVTYPSYLLHNYHHLQRLELGDDKRVEDVVFDIDSQQSLQLPYLEFINLTSLEMSHVWKCNWYKFLHQPLNFPFQNLKYISLYSCHKIKYLFSPLMVISLPNLKSVCMSLCRGIEEVISSKYDENEEHTSTSSHQNTTLFSCLDTLMLHDLPCLKRIDEGNTRRIRDKISSNITSISHDRSEISDQVVGACWSLCQYPRNISIRRCDALSNLISWYVVGQMKRLEELEIKSCKMMMEVFESESINNNTNDVDEGSAGTMLTSPTLNKITTVAVPQLYNLKSVSIHECDLLPHLFTFSTLQSLKQLKVLRVTRCHKTQVIVKENETSSEVVVFPRLETLELDDLPNLKGFFLGMNEFVWPSLVNVVINNCPQLMMFTSGKSETPKLKYIRSSLGKHSLECGLNFHGTITEYQR